MLEQRRATLEQNLTAAAQALDWAVIEKAATQRLTSKQLATLEAGGLIGQGARDEAERRKEVADLGRRLGALDALIEAVDELQRERRNR